MSVSIKVGVRCRPFTIDDSLGVDLQQNDDENGEVNLINSTYSTNRFPFTYAWWSAYGYQRRIQSDNDVADNMKLIDQEAVYTACGQKIMNDLMEGNAVVLFAYGLSGSGKTFTVFGPDAVDIPEAWFKHAEPHPLWGIFPRLAYALFKDKKDGWKITMKYFQNVVDTVRDLMSPVATESHYKNGMKKDEDGFTDIEWCQSLPLNTWDDLREAFQKANKNKAIAPTQFNHQSTRGHCIMTLEVEMPHPSQEGMKQRGRVYVCDLAGTEPAGDIVYAKYEKKVFENGEIEHIYQGPHADAKKTKELQSQGMKINLSLSEMAQFFMKMAEAVKKKKLKPGASIPGCNSYFLCKYLKDTMLQARTYLFCAVRPEVKYHPYTFSTLGFATNASVVKLQPKKATTAASPAERKLMQELEEMKAMFEKLREENTKLAQGGGGGGEGDSSQLEAMLAAKQDQLNNVLMGKGDAEGGGEQVDSEAVMMAQQREEYGRRGIDLSYYEKETSQPHLINIDEDPFRNERFVYMLGRAVTVFGPSGDIRPLSMGVVKDHCSIERIGGEPEEAASSEAAGDTAAAEGEAGAGEGEEKAEGEEPAAAVAEGAEGGEEAAAPPAEGAEAAAEGEKAVGGTEGEGGGEEGEGAAASPPVSAGAVRIVLVGGKGETFVNGEIVEEGQRVELKTFDRIALGSGELLSFRQPGVELPEGQDAPTPEEAVEELQRAMASKDTKAQAMLEERMKAFEDEKKKWAERQQHAADSGATFDDEEPTMDEEKERAWQAIDRDILEVLPKTKEAKNIVKLMDRDSLTFDVALQRCEDSSKSGGAAAVPKVKVKVVNTVFSEGGDCLGSNSILLDPIDFLRGFSILKDELVHLRTAQENDREYTVNDYNDPINLLFNNTFHLGTGIVFPEFSQYNLETEDDEKMVDIKNVSPPYNNIGAFEITWTPLGGADEEHWGDPITEPEEPKDLIGKAWTYRIKIKGATGLPIMVSEAFVQYDFNGTLFTTETVQQDTHNPHFDYEQVHHIPCVTQEFLECLERPLQFHIWASPYVVAAKNKVSTSNKFVLCKTHSERRRSSMGGIAAMGGMGGSGSVGGGGGGGSVPQSPRAAADANKVLVPKDLVPRLEAELENSKLKLKSMEDEITSLKLELQAFRGAPSPRGRLEMAKKLDQAVEDLPAPEEELAAGGEGGA